MAATVLAAPFAVHAQPISGLYVAGGAGANLLQDTTVKHFTPTNKPGFGGGTNFRYDIGPVVVASVGYGLGNGLRIELEGTGMQNKVNKVKSATRRPIGCWACKSWPPMRATSSPRRALRWNSRPASKT